MHYFAVKVVADSKFMASCYCCCLALCGGVWYVTLSLETSYLTLQSAVRKACTPTHNNILGFELLSNDLPEFAYEFTSIWTVFCVFCAHFSAIWEWGFVIVTPKPLTCYFCFCWFQRISLTMSMRMSSD